MLFPDFDVFAAIINRLPTGIIHSQFIRATDEAKVAGFRHFYFGRFPTDDEAGAGEHVLPYLPDFFLSGCNRSVRRQHNGVSGVVRHRFVEILAACSFRPGGISVAKSLFSLRVASQADSWGCKAKGESEYQCSYFHENDRAWNSVFRQRFLFSTANYADTADLQHESNPPISVGCGTKDRCRILDSIYSIDR